MQTLTWTDKSINIIQILFLTFNDIFCLFKIKNHDNNRNHHNQPPRQPSSTITHVVIIAGVTRGIHWTFLLEEFLTCVKVIRSLQSTVSFNNGCVDHDSKSFISKIHSSWKNSFYTDCFYFVSEIVIDHVGTSKFWQIYHVGASFIANSCAVIAMESQSCVKQIKINGQLRLNEIIFVQIK